MRLAWSRLAAGSPNVGRGPLTIRGAVTDFFHPEHVVQFGVGVVIELVAARWWRAGDRPGGCCATRSSGCLPVDVDDTRRTTVDAPRDDASVAVCATRAGAVTPARRWPLVTTTLVAALALVAGLTLLFRAAGPNASGLDILPVSGTPATVEPGTAWNVRSGPSTSAARVGQVNPGDELMVACTCWSRLADPMAGGYVSSNGLRLTESPPRC